MPKVSVGLPVYNGEQYLAESIESILAQSLGDLELIVCDNASTDGTEEICRDYLRRDRRVRYNRQPGNLGAARNFNAAFRLSTGEYFHWQSYDDIALPDFLLRCVQALEAEGSRVSVVFPRWTIIDERGAQVTVEGSDYIWRGQHPHQRFEDLIGNRPNSLLRRCIPVFGVMRRRLLEQTGLLRPYASSDEVLIVELALRGDLRELPEVLFLRRIHPKNYIRANLTAEARIAWFDPSKGRSFPMSRTRLALGYLARALEAPIPPGEKLRCLQAELRWLGRGEWRVIGGEIKIKLRQWITRSTVEHPLRHKFQQPN
jgi:glycosyltransferase involved in cell wall biosynthesis